MSRLQEFLKAKLQPGRIGLMTHLVLGYPSFAENEAMIGEMVQAGVEVIELQIPFSEPSADGPVIVKANALSLEAGTKVSHCVEFAGRMAALYPQTAFLFMTYYNILFQRGIPRMLDEAAQAGVMGFILPDLPLEEAGDLPQQCAQRGLSNILIFTPTHDPERLTKLGQASQGLVYAVGRRGITGQKTDFAGEMAQLISTYKAHTLLPLALGFGVKSAADVAFLQGKADLAVIGTKLIELQETAGSQAVGRFLRELR